MIITGIVKSVEIEQYLNDDGYYRNRAVVTIINDNGEFNAVVDGTLFTMGRVILIKLSSHSEEGYVNIRGKAILFRETSVYVCGNKDSNGRVICSSINFVPGPAHEYTHYEGELFIY